MKFQELLKVHIKGERTETETMKSMVEKPVPKLGRRTVTPNILVPDPIQPDKHNALTIYRWTHGCSFAVIIDQFGVLMALAIESFNYVIRKLVACFNNDHVKIPENEDEWKEELKGFIENYEFPCAGT